MSCCKTGFVFPEKTLQLISVLGKKDNCILIDIDVIPSLMQQMWDAGYKPKDIPASYLIDVREMFECPPDVTTKRWAEMLLDSWRRLNEAEDELGMSIEDAMGKVRIGRIYFADKDTAESKPGMKDEDKVESEWRGFAFNEEYLREVAKAKATAEAYAKGLADGRAESGQSGSQSESTVKDDSDPVIAWRVSKSELIKSKGQHAWRVCEIGNIYDIFLVLLEDIDIELQHALSGDVICVDSEYAYLFVQEEQKLNGGSLTSGDSGLSVVIEETHNMPADGYKGHGSIEIFTKGKKLKWCF